MPDNPSSAQPMETGDGDGVQPPASGHSGHCVQCAAADSSAWRSVANGAGQICFNCFEATAVATELLQPPAEAETDPPAGIAPAVDTPFAADATPKQEPAETAVKEPEESEAQPPAVRSASPDEEEVVANVAEAANSAGTTAAEAEEVAENAEPVINSSSSDTAMAADPGPAPDPATTEPMELETEPSEPAADEQQRRLRKSTRSTRYKSKVNTSSPYAKPNSAGGAASGSAAAGSTSHPSHSSSSSSAAATTANGNHNQQQHSNQHSGGGTIGGGGAGGNSSGPASAASTSAKSAHPRGRSRRGAVFKKTAPQRAPTVTATTRCVQHVFHRGSYVQLGDIVSVLGHTEHTYYAQIRGLLVDSFCEKSAWLTWLLPTAQSPPPDERFEAGTYVIGPDEERPRRLDCMQFVQHAPSGYYHSRTEPYPVPDGWVGDSGAAAAAAVAVGAGAGGCARIGRVAAERRAGFIWTSMPEADGGGQRVKRHRAAAEAAAAKA